MDNVSHSLIGVAVGHVALKVFERKALLRNPPETRRNSAETRFAQDAKSVECGELVRSSRFRSLVLWTSILSNNAPDIDVVFPKIMKWLHLGGTDPKLIQLLEHRGFTHTVVASPILGILCLGDSLDTERRNQKEGARYSGILA